MKLDHDDEKKRADFQLLIHIPKEFVIVVE